MYRPIRATVVMTELQGKLVDHLSIGLLERFVFFSRLMTKGLYDFGIEFRIS